MVLALMLVMVVGTYAIYRLLRWSSETGNKLGNAASLGIALVMLFSMSSLAHDEPKASLTPKPKPVQSSVATVPSKPDALDATKSRIKAYLNSLPGAGVVIVRGSPAVIVECDYDFGTADKETAKGYATDLIYDIMGANGDCNFNLISVNCMNGKTPIGIIVNYEGGRFYTLP